MRRGERGLGLSSVVQVSGVQGISEEDVDMDVYEHETWIRETDFHIHRKHIQESLSWNFSLMSAHFTMDNRCKVCQSLLTSFLTHHCNFYASNGIIV